MANILCTRFIHQQHIFFLLQYSFCPQRLTSVSLSLELMPCFSVRPCRSQAPNIRVPMPNFWSISSNSLSSSLPRPVAPHHPSQLWCSQGWGHPPQTSGLGVPSLWLFLWPWGLTLDITSPSFLTMTFKSFNLNSAGTDGLKEHLLSQMGPDTLWLPRILCSAIRDLNFHHPRALPVVHLDAILVLFLYS